MSEVMDPVTVIYKIKREMSSQMETLVQTLANGGVDSMEEYKYIICLLYTSPSPRDKRQSRMPSSA